MTKLDSIMLARKTILTNDLLNKTIKVHNGKIYDEFIITETMIGFKVGFFSSTRQIYQYKKNGKKN